MDGRSRESRGSGADTRSRSRQMRIPARWVAAFARTISAGMLNWTTRDRFNYFNIFAFRTAVWKVSLGNVGRNTLRGPGINNWDVSLFKNTRINEKVNVQLRFETFNVFNHTQWDTVEYFHECAEPGRRADAGDSRQRRHCHQHPRSAQHSDRNETPVLDCCCVGSVVHFAVRIGAFFGGRRCFRGQPSPMPPRPSPAVISLLPNRASDPVLKSQPDHIGALGNLGVIYSRSGRTHEAIEVYRRALKLAPNDAPLLVNLGLGIPQGR